MVEEDDDDGLKRAEKERREMNYKWPDGKRMGDQS